MALDNAEFIAELSILDPPGTDPLNQGDDHIRTVKRATQQSFPNVNAAVPQTAAQMAQMAIKNEANTFTQLNIFDANIRVSPGTIAAPGYHFNTDTATGFSRAAGSILHVSAGGANPFSFHPTQMIGTVPIYQHNGTPLLPSYSFSNQADTGMYRDTSSRISFASAGVFKMLIDFTHVEAVVPFVAPQGNAGEPGFSFAGQSNKGFYHLANDIIGVSTIGIERLRIQGAFFKVNQPISLINGSTGAPAYTFASDLTTGITYNGTNGIDAIVGGAVVFAMSTNGMFAGAGFQIHADGALITAAKPGFAFGNDADTGFYRPAANTLGFAAGGVSLGTMDSSALWTANGVSIHGDAAGSTANPSYAFTNDTDTGMYRVQANVLGWSCGNVEVMTLGTGGFGIAAGTPTFLSLPTTPGFGGSLWNDAGTVKVA